MAATKSVETRMVEAINRRLDITSARFVEWRRGAGSLTIPVFAVPAAKVFEARDLGLVVVADKDGQ